MELIYLSNISAREEFVTQSLTTRWCSFAYLIVGLIFHSFLTVYMTTCIVKEILMRCRLLSLNLRTRLDDAHFFHCFDGRTKRLTQSRSCVNLLRAATTFLM